VVVSVGVGWLPLGAPESEAPAVDAREPAPEMEWTGCISV
jgi:hypothetical protein